MELTPKNHKLIKTRHYIKTNNLIFIYNGVNQNYLNWVISEQKMKTLNINYFKVSNKITIKIFKKSLHYGIVSSINAIICLIKLNLSQKNLPKNSELAQLNPSLFILIMLKINNKIYSIKQFHNLKIEDYKNNRLLFFQFRLATLKWVLNRIK
jgi:hypothetical protein